MEDGKWKMEKLEHAEHITQEQLSANNAIGKA